MRDPSLSLTRTRTPGTSRWTCSCNSVAPTARWASAVGLPVTTITTSTRTRQLRKGMSVLLLEVGSESEAKCDMSEPGGAQRRENLGANEYPVVEIRLEPPGQQWRHRQ